jgi:very-short-patch-repair endonuclease
VLVAGSWYRLDFAWPAPRVALEADGRRRHANRSAFERDRAWWTALAAAGWRVLVVTWNEITKHPETVLNRVASALVTAA